MIVFLSALISFFFFFQAEDGIRDVAVTGVQTCALPISPRTLRRRDRRFGVRGAQAPAPSRARRGDAESAASCARDLDGAPGRERKTPRTRSEEHTSELQSRLHLVCRLLLEKKKSRDRRDASPSPTT